MSGARWAARPTVWLFAALLPITAVAACSLLTPTDELTGGALAHDAGAPDVAPDVTPDVSTIDGCDGHQVAASCGDKKQSGDETDLDCGGSCCPCSDGRHCVEGGDCKNGICFNGVCAPPSCSDGVHNGNETDIDCGGGLCPGCADAPVAQHCKVDSDCLNLDCVQLACVPPSCSDKKKDGKESDVDCGGSCKKCPVAKLCQTGADCESSDCSPVPGTSTPVCQSCPDGKKNGDETDVDCGGGGPCAPCGADAGCKLMADCTSGKCVNKACAP